MVSRKTNLRRQLIGVWCGPIFAFLTVFASIGIAHFSTPGVVVLVTAGAPAFTQSGPLAYRGLLGFYVPMLICGSWMLSHTWYMRKMQAPRHTTFAA